MSRRHKEIPKITTEELLQIAEETSSSAVDSVARGYLFDNLTVHLIRPSIDKIKADITEHLFCQLHEKLSPYIEIGVEDRTPQVKCIVGVDKRRGRPKIMELFDRFKDTDLINILKEAYYSIQQKALDEADRKVTEHFVCFLLAMCSIEDVDSYGLVEHYHRVLSQFLPYCKIPTVKTLQNKINKFERLVKLFGSKVHAYVKKCEEVFYIKVSKLKRLYMEKINEIAPKYALF